MSNIPDYSVVHWMATEWLALDVEEIQLHM
jgi:hypothetical protein